MIRCGKGHEGTLEDWGKECPRCLVIDLSAALRAFASDPCVFPRGCRPGPGRCSTCKARDVLERVDKPCIGFVERST